MLIDDRLHPCPDLSLTLFVSVLVREPWNIHYGRLPPRPCFGMRNHGQIGYVDWEADDLPIRRSRGYRDRHGSIALREEEAQVNSVLVRSLVARMTGDMV
jgi:hypothetical protein